MSSVYAINSYRGVQNYRTFVRNAHCCANYSIQNTANPTFRGAAFDSALATGITDRIMTLVKKNKPEEAYRLLCETPKERINPNYRVSVGFFDYKHPFVLLLDKHESSNINQDTRNIYFNIAHAICMHEDFDPNYKIIHSKDCQESLIEYAIRKKSDLMASLLINNPKLKVDDERLRTLLAAAKENHLYFCEGRIKEILATRTSKPQKNGKSGNLLNHLAQYEVVYRQSDPKSLADVGGMDEAKAIADEFIIQPWKNENRIALLENNIPLPNGFLLYGPPGCGKTHLAKAIAAEMGLPLYEIDMGKMGSSNAYATENLFNNVFTALENNYKQTGTPSVLLLDELDTICGNRSDTNTDWKRGEINTLLKLINNVSERGIVLLGATNLLKNLDPAVLRTGRFDKKIEIKLPDEQSRKSIFLTLAKKSPIAKNVPRFISRLVDLTEGATCSDIAATYNTALRKAIIAQKKSVNFSDFEIAYNKIKFDSENNTRKIGFLQ